MYAIVIGASGESVYAIKKAKSKGLHIIAFDENENAEGLKYADESFVVDIRNPQKIFDIIDNKNIDPKEMVVLPVPIGRYIISSGSFNDHYGLIGPSRKTTEICTDKWLFHETLSKESLREAEHQLVNAGKLPDKPQKFPVILKPRYGAGSRDVLFISNENEWENALNNFPCEEDFIVEDAIGGTEYGVDGLVFNGDFHTVLIRKKIITLPPYRQCVGYLSITEANDDRITSVVQSYMEKLTSAIELKDGVVHADIMIEDNKPFVIEMSARPSGHRLHDLFTPMVTGVDMISVYIDYCSGKSNSIAPQKREDIYLIRYFDIETEVRRIPNRSHMMDKYNLLEYECNMVEGEKKKIKDGHSLMGRGFFVLKDKTEELACKKANELLREFI